MAADSTYLSVEGVTDETDASAGNSQMTPTVTGGSIKIDSATFTNWPLEGKTRSVRYSGTSASGGCFSSVNPSSPAGGWETLLRAHAEGYPSAATSFFQQRPSSGTNIDIKMTTGGVIQIYNSVNSLLYSFAALTFPGTYYWGVYTKPDSSVGEITFLVWSATGTLIESYTTTAANTGSGASVSIRVGSKVNSSTAVWDLWLGVVENNHTSETALTLGPPTTNPVGASHIVNGWIYDDTTDATAGALSISGVTLTPSTPYLIDNTNHRVAVQASNVPIAYSYTVTNGTTGRTGTVTGTIPASTGGTPSPAQLMRMVDGELVEML